jgi:flagellar operon protein
MSPISNPALLPPGSLAGVGGATPGAPTPAPGVPGVPAQRPGGAPAADPARRGARGAPGAHGAPAQGAPSFADALAHAGNAPAQAGKAHAQAGLQFSKHALARVQRRGIEIGASTLGRLAQGVDRAACKGSRDSLVLVDGTAFVVSVSNRTVITAVASEHMKDNVFTNIDSAVIA